MIEVFKIVHNDLEAVVNLNFKGTLRRRLSHMFFVLI